MPPTRILTFAGHLGSVGGTETAQLTIFEVLAARGWAIDLLYRSWGDYGERWQAFTDSMRPAGSALPERGAPISSTLAAGRLVITGIRRRPDLVYVHNAGDVPAALAVGRAARAPVVVHLHVPPPIRQPGWLNAFLRRTAAAVAPSPDTADRWRLAATIPADRMWAVPTGVDLDRFAPMADEVRQAVRAELGVAPDQHMVLFVGRVERIKGAHFLLEAARALTEPVRTVLAGAISGDDYEEELRRADPDALLLGRRQDLPRLMGAADLVVVPSNCLETQGLVVHEAMACGTPVVASDIAGLTSSMAGFPELLVPPADPVALSRVMGRHIGWRTEQPDLGPRSRRWAEANASIDVTTSAIERVLMGALAGRDGPPNGAGAAAQ